MAQTKQQDRVQVVLARKCYKNQQVLYLVKWCGNKPDSWEKVQKVRACGSVELNKFSTWVQETGVDKSKSIARQEALNSAELNSNGNYRIKFLDQTNSENDTRNQSEIMTKAKKNAVKPSKAKTPKVKSKVVKGKANTSVSNKTGITSKVKNVKSINMAKAEKVRSKAQKVLQKQPTKKEVSPKVQNIKTKRLRSLEVSGETQSNVSKAAKGVSVQKAVKKKPVSPANGKPSATKKLEKSPVRSKDPSTNVLNAASCKTSPNKSTKSKGSRKQELSTPKEDCTNSGSESDTLYSLGTLSTPKRLKLELVDFRQSPSTSTCTSRSTTPQPDSEISFKITSPVRKLLLKDSVKKKQKFRNKPAEAETKSGISPALPLPATPSSLIGPSYKQDKTPPGTPTRVSCAATPTKPSDLYSGFSRIPNVPVIPNSPAASYKNLMKTLQNLQADKGIKRKHADNDEPIERRSSVRQSESIFKYKEIAVKKSAGYTQIWLVSQTKIKNSLNPQVFSELIQALHNAKFDDSRVVMLSGYGSTFCSGIDLQYLTTGDCRTNAKRMVDSLKEFVKTMISFPKPVVAAVNGSAVGLGTTILPLCDIVYASDKATFSCPYSRLGHTPEGCGSYTLPQVVGMAMGNEMLLGGRRLTAQEACQVGLVSQVFWPTSLMQEVIPRVQQMAQSSAKALEASKLVIRSHQKTKLEFTCDSECSVLTERWSSPDCIKAIRTYLEREENFL